MNRAIYPVLSGALAQEQRLQAITNNLSNLGTIGFKREIPSFRSLLEDPGIRIPLSPKASLGLRVYATAGPTKTDYSAGHLRETGNPLDLALEGTGFFEIQTPNGLRYTRNGQFRLDPQRRLVDRDGHPVMGIVNNQSQALTLPQGAVTISATGDITAGGQPLGRLRVVHFEKPDDLIKLGNNLFVPQQTTPIPAPAGTYAIRQGSMETANVNAVEELVTLIQIQRAYESSQKMLQTLDQMTDQTIQNVGRSS